MQRFSRRSAASIFALCAATFLQSALAQAPKELTQKDLTPVKLKPAANHPPIVLADAGQPQGTICVMAPRTRALSEAVTHLQTMIQKSTGAKLEIVDGKITPPAIVIGDCDLAKANGLVGKDLPVEGFAVKTIADHVLIVGHDELLVGELIRSEGTALGIIDFLERIVGVRWYSPLELGQSIPKLQQLAVAPVSYDDAPVFRKREIWPPMANPWNGTGTQLMGFHNFLRAGNSWPRQLVVHAPDWSKVKEYTDGRPEIFQMRSDGTRETMMLCYGNRRTLDTYLENIEAARAGGTSRLGIVGSTVTVSPADAEIACYCPDCRKLWNEEGGQYGSASKVVGQFVANLGREVQKRWPDMTVLYLPYLNYTSAPDGVEFPNNIEVQLCGMPGLAQYKEPSIAAEEQQTIDRWIKISGRPIQNWHYSCWPEDRTAAVYLFPHVIRDFYQQNRAKTVGTFINGTTDHWPRQQLSLYCWMKILWNPDFDVDAAIDEHCTRMYGPAAGTMRKLVAMQIDGWEKSRWPGNRMSAKGVNQVSFPYEQVIAMQGLLDQARKEAAGDKLALERIEYYAVPFPEFVKQSEQYHKGGGLKPLIAQKVGENPKLDGKLDDEVWKRATPNAFVRAWDKQRSETFYPTTVQAVWTPEGITFGFRMTEPTPDLLERGIKGRDDSMAWWDDNVEMLLDVTGKNEGEFYHIIVNANAAVADAKGKDFSQDYQAIQYAVNVGSDHWSLECYIPYTALADILKPGSGTQTAWYGNFTRHRVADQGLKPKVNRAGNSQREYQRMNTTYALPSTNLSDLAPIKFQE